MFRAYFDYRYIYLMERKSKRSFWAKVSFQREVKIGIAKNAKSRSATVNRAIKGDVVIIMKRKVLFAEHIEKNKLHKKFADSRFKMKGKKGKRGGGLTEWFFLSSTELFLLRCWLLWYWIRPYFYFSIAVILISLFIHGRYF